MAPKTANKRSAQEQKTVPIAKKPKVDPMVNGVIEAIQQVDIAPDTCKDMLIAMVGSTLGTPSDLRHKLQQKGVEMIGEVIEEHRNKLQQAITAEANSVQSADAKKSELANKEQAAKDNLAVVSQEFESQKMILAETSKPLFEQRAEVAKAHTAKESGDARLTEIKRQHEEYEIAMTQHLRAALNDDINGEQSKAHFEALRPVLAKIGLEDSLAQALPSGFAKKPAERSTFDNLAIKSLEETLSSQIATLAKDMKEETSAAEERAAAVTAAQEAHDAAKSKQNDVAEELKTRRSAKEEAEAAYKAAKAATAEYEIEYQKLTAIRDSKKEELTAFESYNVECYNMLRDKISKKPDAPSENTPSEDTIQAGGA